MWILCEELTFWRHLEAGAQIDTGYMRWDFKRILRWKNPHIWSKRPLNKQIICILIYFYSGQVAKCSRIAPPGHGLDATSWQEQAEAGQGYAEVEHNHTEEEQKYDAQGV